MKPSVLIIAHNEADNIAEAVSSALFADEIVVVDNGSDDNTGKIASSLGANVIRSEKNIGYSDAKKLGLKHCSAEWVFWLDADERISKNLADEILAAIEKQKEFVAFKIPRKSFFLGKWIRHCGWYPDYVLRLFRKDRAKFSDDLVHEKLLVNGAIRKLSSPILHYTDPTLGHYIAKLNHYTTLGAQQMRTQGKRATICDILFRPAATFIKMFIIKLGFLDGIHGFVLCTLSAVHTMVKYAKSYFGERKN